MRKKLFFLVLLILVLGLGVWSVQAEEGQFVLPEDINIVPPSSDLPTDVAVLSGRWEGEWNGTAGPWLALLIVEKISKNERGKINAQAIYAWSPYSDGQPEFVRFRSRISRKRGNPKIIFSRPLLRDGVNGSSTVIFVFSQDDNAITGYYSNSFGGSAKITMNKIVPD